MMTQAADVLLYSHRSLRLCPLLSILTFLCHLCCVVSIFLFYFIHFLSFLCALRLVVERILYFRTLYLGYCIFSSLKFLFPLYIFYFFVGTLFFSICFKHVCRRISIMAAL
jgi:hypothetical protein